MERQGHRNLYHSRRNCGQGLPTSMNHEGHEGTRRKALAKLLFASSFVISSLEYHWVAEEYRRLLLNTHFLRVASCPSWFIDFRDLPKTSPPRARPCILNRLR